MLTVLNKPDLYGFLGNLKKIEVASSSAVSFTLKCRGEVVLSSTYEPTLDRINVDVSDVVADYLSSIIPDVSRLQFFAPTQFSFLVDSLPEYEFNVLPGGVDAVIDSGWFKANFLTWQPQTVYTQWLQPQWLSYFPERSCSLFCKAYFSDGTISEIKIADLMANVVNTMSLQYSTIPQMFNNKTPQYFDVWIADGGNRLSYIQRYVLRGIVNNDDYFIFLNSLGGWDAVLFSGKLQHIGEVESSTAVLEDITKEYSITAKQKFTKNTGYFESGKAAMWSLEFLRSSQKYWVNEAGVMELIVVEKTNNSITLDEPNSYTFNFYSSREKKYQNLTRTESPAAPIEIIDPYEKLFFLAPRLTEFAVAGMNDSLLFPVQDPHSEKWKSLSWGIIKRFISDIVTNGIKPLSHYHSNKATLDKLAISAGGKLLFDGAEIEGGASADHDHADKIVRAGVLVVPGEPPADLLAKVKPGEVRMYHRSSGFGGATPGAPGVSSYADITEKPSINGIELKAGNNTLFALGIAAASHGHDYSALYASKTHDHVIENITGLLGALNSKASSIHDHAGQVLNPAMLGIPKDSEFDSTKAQTGRSYMLRRSTGFGGATPGAAGVSSYADITEKPKIGGVELAAGENSLSRLGIAAANHSHSQYLTGITSAMVTSALGFTPLSGSSLSDYYTKTVSDSRFAGIAGSLSQDFSAKKLVSKTLVIPGTAPAGLAAGEVAMYRRDSGFGGAVPGVGGVSSYVDLTDKPQINGVELKSGNNNLIALGIASSIHDHDYSSLAPKVHIHAIADVTGLQVALDGKQPVGSYAAAVHTHNYVSQVKLGTVAYNVASNLITLPAYPTTLPASDVYAWAKAANKPVYGWTEITGKPTTVSGYGITDVYTKSVSDSRFAKLAGDLAQDFSAKKLVSKTLVIPGTAPEGLAAGESAIFRRASGFGGATPGAGGGVSAYVDLTGKPQIGGIELVSGNNTISRLGLAAAYHIHDISHISGLQGVLDGKAASAHDHSQYALSTSLDSYYTKTISDSRFAPKSHRHPLREIDVIVNRNEFNFLPSTYADTYVLFNYKLTGQVATGNVLDYYFCKGSGSSSELGNIRGNNFYSNNNLVLHAGNYNSYSPTLTGGKASGTWPISITGNAATATNATNATNLNNVPFSNYMNKFHGYSNGAPAAPGGYVKVKFIPNARWMISFTLRIIDNYKTLDILISGYNYGDRNWSSSTATALGGTIPTKDVIFGYDEPGYLWVAVPREFYTSATVFGVNNAYGQTDWGKNIQVITETELTGTTQITRTVYAPLGINGGTMVGNVSTSHRLTFTGSNYPHIVGNGGVLSFIANISDNSTLLYLSDVTKALYPYKAINLGLSTSPWGNIYGTNGFLTNLTVTGTLTGDASNALKLGGQLPSFYAEADLYYTKVTSDSKFAAINGNTGVDFFAKKFKASTLIIPSTVPVGVLAGEAAIYRRSSGFGGAMPGAPGVSSYVDLTEKPQIGGVELKAGNNTLSALGISATSHVHDYSSLYASKAHVHAVADVTGLQGVLDGKANATDLHTHENKSFLDTLTTTMKTNWDTSFGWGNHALAGYLKNITSALVTGALGFTPAAASDLNSYYTKVISDSRFAAIAGSLSKDFSAKKLISKTLLIPGEAPTGLVAGESAIYRRTSGFGGATPGAGGGVSSYVDITGKPKIGGVELASGDNTLSRLGLAALYHIHDVSHVSGLQGILDGKQPAGSYAAATHNHPISQITGLQTALDSKQAAGSYAAASHGHSQYALSTSLNDYLKKSGGTVTGPLEISTGAINNNFNEGLRLTSANNNWVGITFGTTGLEGMNNPSGWFIAKNQVNQFIISPGGSENTTGLTLNKSGDVYWRNNIIWHAGNLNRSDVSFNVYDLYLNAAIRSESPVSFLNESMAQKIYTGGVLASRNYSDAWAVPEQGIFARGVIMTGDRLRVQNLFGYTEIGPQNEGHCHFYTDMPNFYFNKELRVNGDVYGGSAYNRRLAYVDEIKGMFYNTSSQIDLRGLDSNKFYPIHFQLGTHLKTRIRIWSALDSNVPSWSTHQQGFTLNLEWESNGAGWGATPRQTVIYNNVQTFCNGDIAGNLQQNTMGSQEIIFLRGGGLYRYWTSDNSVANVNPNGYSWVNGQYSYSAPVVNSVDRRLRGEGTVVFGSVISNRFHNDGLDFYIGNANNGGWMGCQDMCSMASLSDSYWSIRTNGQARFQSIYGRNTLHVYAGGGNYNEGIRLYGITASGSWSNIHFGCDPSTEVGTHSAQWIMGRNDQNNFVIDMGGSADSTFCINTAKNIVIGGSNWGYKLNVGGIMAIGSWIYSYGDYGWYSATYGGGIYMTDSSYVRIYNGKRFYCDSTELDCINAHGGIYSNGTNGHGLTVTGTEATTTRIKGQIGAGAYQTVSRYEVQWYNEYFRFDIHRGGSTDIMKASWKLNDSEIMSLSRTGDLTVSGAVDAGALCIPFGPPANPQSGKRYLFRRNA